MLKSHLNWMKEVYKFSEEEMFEEYGKKSFEQKPVKPDNTV
ncbi:MAG: hypothetical protein Q4B34_00730 [Candidatus Saccharibacteria bacterium]|nr:hypothetical protein [Candidatus Saccharibacteria bacterium]